MRGSISTLLTLYAAALAAASGAVLLAVGLPLASAGSLRPAAVLSLAAGEAILVLGLGAAILVRWVGRPVSRLLHAAEQLEGQPGGLPLLGPPGEEAAPELSRAAIAFERTVAALAAERTRLADKVAELERANADLLRARESLLRAERLATLGRLASGIAHEVGNPLGAIAGYVELARDPQRSPAEISEFLGRIGEEAQRIDRIVRDLLDLARPAEALLGTVELGPPVDAALRLARVQARFRPVQVEVAIAPELPPVVADERRLAQVFLNLFLNAGDAMGGAGRVRVEASPDGERVAVRISDTGPGIAPEDLPRVFEPFFTTKGAGKGTGLGLAVSQGIVESFGGELLAANAPQGGAVFTLLLRPTAR